MGRSAAESRHLARVKELPCGVCGAAGPSEAHHVLEGRAAFRKSPDMLAIPLCPSCHRDDHCGIHGRRAMWDVLRKGELDVLAETLQRLFYR